MTVTKIQQIDEIKPNTYYRYTAAPEVDKCSKDFIDNLVLVSVIDTERDEVHYHSGDHDFEDPIATFRCRFEEEPNGLAIRSGTVQEMMRVNEEETADLMKIEGMLQLSSPLQPDVQDEESNIPGEQNALMIPIGDVKKANALKNALATSTMNIEEKMDAIAVRTKQVKNILSERSSALHMQVGKLKKFVSKMNELVWTISLYLGNEEQLVQLKEGASAPPETPIAIRQLVLWMAEECAVAAEEGGINAWTIFEFDKWLLEKQEHIDQVIPDQKGIVVLKPTKLKSRSSNAYEREAKDKANQHTYFLMRNGENLYRIDTDLEVYDTLYPGRSDFDQVFTGRRFNYDTHEYEEVVLTPGTRDYMDALEKASGLQRHFMRILLYIQGVIHRTHVFEPTPIPKEQIDVMNHTYHDEFVRYIRDAEMTLGTGRLAFKDWLADINSKLEVGRRVIGDFHSYNFHERMDREDRKRLHPVSANRPIDMQIYTIEAYDKKDGAFILRYPRDEQVLKRGRWGDFYMGPAAKRASFKIFPRDSFVINYDLVTIEDIDYYLGNRTDRCRFLEMFPLLKTVRAMKRQEQEEEAPFRLLLISKLAEVSSMQKAEERIDELINWWKFKNKNHRCLLVDDVLAFNMIVKEFKLRLRKDEQRKGSVELHTQVARLIREQSPKALYIAHKIGVEYVCLVPENDKNVFVNEQTWGYDAGMLGLVSEKRWTVVDNRRMRWWELFATTRWQEWNFDAKYHQYLSDPEIEEVTKEGLEIAETRHAKHLSYRWNAKKHPCFLPVFVRVENSGSFNRDSVEVFAITDKGLLNHERPLTKNQFVYDFERFEMTWSKNTKGVKLGDCHTYDAEFETYFKVYKNEKSEDRWSHDKGDKWVSWRNPENFEIWKFLQREHKAMKLRIKELNKIGESYIQLITKEMKARQEAKLYADFMTTHGKVEVWSEYRKSLEVKDLNVHDKVWRALSYIIERDEKPDGLTLQEVIDLAKESGMSMEELDHWKHQKNPVVDLSNHPLDMVLHLPRLETVFEDEEEDDDNDEEEEEQKPKLDPLHEDSEYFRSRLRFEHSNEKDAGLEDEDDDEEDDDD